LYYGFKQLFTYVKIAAAIPFDKFGAVNGSIPNDYN
jgi:hypothetical protein